MIRCNKSREPTSSFPLRWVALSRWYEADLTDEEQSSAAVTEDVVVVDVLVLLNVIILRIELTFFLFLERSFDLAPDGFWGRNVSVIPTYFYLYPSSAQ